MIMTRREFIYSCGAVGAGAAFCVPLTVAAGNQQTSDNYAVAVLGDTHYDAEPESVYHSHYDVSKRNAKIHRKEFVRNGEMWRERCPSMIAASAALAAKTPTRFILQLGDIIQGDCDDVPTHKKMLDDCIKMLRKPYPASLPFLTVMGNHDFRGKGARRAYLDFAKSYMTGEIASLTGKKPEAVKYPAFSFRCGRDVWVLCDFETVKGLESVCKLIEGAHDARHVFLVTHGPFTPSVMTRWPFWRLAGSKACDAMRHRLYEALSRRRAVVLSGHTHTTSFYRFENKWGGFAEATVNSVWSKPEIATAAAMHCGLEQYAPNFKNVRKKDREAYANQVEFFKGSLSEYFCGKGAGHYRLDVSDDGVKLSFYPGAAEKTAKVFTLKKGS